MAHPLTPHRLATTAQPGDDPGARLPGRRHLGRSRTLTYCTLTALLVAVGGGMSGRRPQAQAQGSSPEALLLTRLAALETRSAKLEARSVQAEARAARAETTID